MADILIRGMEMPKYTTKAEFGIDADGNPLCMVYHEDGTDPDIYDVVPLPKGHGRLIDADKLAEDLQLDVENDQRALDDLNIVGVNRERIQFDKDCKQNYMWYLSECPTIIPAEGGRDDG